MSRGIVLKYTKWLDGRVTHSCLLYDLPFSKQEEHFSSSLTGYLHLKEGTDFLLGCDSCLHYPGDLVLRKCIFLLSKLELCKKTPTPTAFS